MPHNLSSSVPKLSASVQIASRQVTPTGFLARLARLTRLTQHGSPEQPKNLTASSRTGDGKTYHFALAVSGGADSLSMMLLAANARQQKKTQKTKTRQTIHYQFSILTVNHGLRPQAAQEARYVAKLAKKLRLPHHILTWRGAKPKSDIQAAARDIRYQLMTNWCRKHKADGLVLAHHLDDQAETVLLRLIRGAGVDGLAAMQAVRYQNGVPLLRPFLDVPRAVLHKTMLRAQITPVCDPSNTDTRFTRVQIRQLMAALADVGLTAAQLAQTAQNMQSARKALILATQEAAQSLLAVDAFGILTLSRAGFADLPEAIALRVLRDLLRRPENYPPRAEKLHRLWQDIIGKKTTLRTLNGYLLHLRRNHVVICRELAAIERDAGAVMRLAAGKSLVWDARYRVKLHRQARQSLTIRALGMDGQQQLRDRGIALPKHIPAAALASLVSVWRGRKLLAVPNILPHKGVKFTILPHLGHNIAPE